jgi:hypothetical protein
MADTKITNLTSAAASTGDELVVSTTAATDRKVTAESVANLARVITLSPQTSTLTPLKFTAPTTAGELNATATAGALEYDGKCFYASVQTGARGVIPTEQFLSQGTSAWTGTTVLTAQKMFDASTGLNGAMNVGPSVSYMFETAYTLTGRSTTTHIVSYGFGGTAAIDRITWTNIVASAAISSVPSATFMNRCTVNNSPINATNTSSTLVVFAQGKLTIGTSGTIIPQITRSAGTIALVVAPESYIRIWPIGSTSVTRVGAVT